MSIPSIEDARIAVDKKDYATAEQIYLDLLQLNSNTTSLKSEKITELQELSTLELGKLYLNENKKDKLIELISKTRELMSIGSFAKSKTTKIIKNLIDLIEKLKPIDNELTIKITKDCISWSIDEKRTFLRQSLQLRLSSLYYKIKNYQESLLIINDLIKEFKKLDDKSSLIEVQLLESKCYFQLKNFTKSRSSITSAKTSANSVYCPVQIQAELDLMSGLLHAEDKDFKTAFSYFYESFENYQLITITEQEIDFKIIKVLKYMLICKIMLGLIDEFNLILNNKNCIKYSINKEIEALKSISIAYSNKSLKEFENCLKIYNVELTQDSIIRSHLSDLYDDLFQKNLLKLIEPYSCIEISHISSVIGLPKNLIENKLSNMILDKIFYGVLDQGNGWLIIYDEPQFDETYDLSLNVINSMSTVVDLLYEKATLLN
ncbi:hypothetical protein CANARDRAFT_220993 [[Candida] arabinofermentans NRRL YB-2248]|uniref:PCI domain-containing protein n=1 Tax=[Candida] arabinofermentans NRRL YB-2248 TaxID=983967 RepID=A0A1E4T0S5_9ASCO|nr:hypothetical protein CANARDRAFT_220993 [[Candida] arabinofermentans NRRL YB-2248]